MLKAKNKTYGSILVFLAIMAAVFFAATSLIDKIKSDSGKIRTQKILLSRLDEQKNQIGRIRADYQNQKKEMGKIEESFLNPKETVDFVVEIEKIAQKAPVKLETKMAAERSGGKDEPVAVFNYQLIVAGKFGNLMRFFEYLENIKYNIKINGLKLTAAENGVKAVVDLEVYISE